MSTTTGEGEEHRDMRNFSLFGTISLAQAFFFFEETSLSEKSQYDSLNLTHLAVSRCLFTAELWSSQMKLQAG